MSRTLCRCNQDDDANRAASVKRLKAETGAARGLLFVTAEYQRSMPGVLKNAIDHAKEGLFDALGNIGADSKKCLQGWIDHRVAWVKKHPG